MRIFNQINKGLPSICSVPVSKLEIWGVPKLYRCSNEISFTLSLFLYNSNPTPNIYICYKVTIYSWQCLQTIEEYFESDIPRVCSKKQVR